MVYYSDTFENKVRTFCMNPGGIVSEEHYDGGIAVVNGHSYADVERRTGNTNFAMLVSSRFTEPFDRPIEYGRYIAQLGNMLTGGGIMVQRLGDLLQGRRTDASRLARSTTIPTLKTAVPGDLSFVLPHRHLTSLIEAMRAFDKVAPGLYSKNTLLYGVEVKFYSSKVAVGEQFETAVRGLYAIGDGARNHPRADAGQRHRRGRGPGYRRKIGRLTSYKQEGAAPSCLRFYGFIAGPLRTSWAP